MKKIPLFLLLSLLLCGTWWVFVETEPAQATDEWVETLTQRPKPEKEKAQAAPEVADSALERRNNKYEIPLEGDEVEPAFFTLAVTDKESGEVLRDIEVLWVETPWRQHIKKEEWDQVLEATGQTARTNSQGKLHLPRNENNIDLLVRGKGFYGRARRSPREKKNTLEMKLVQDQTLKVQLHHADGTPAANFLVSYVQVHGPETSRKRAVARSNQEGLAIFEHFQEATKQADPLLIQALIVGIPTSKTVQQRFSLEDAIPSNIELTLPPLGFVDIIARLADGTLEEDGTEVMVQKKGSWNLHIEELLGFDSHTLMNGRVRVPVGLGLELDAFIIKNWTDTFWVRGLGPTAPGEIITLQLKQEEAPCVLAGVILKPDGSPLANSSLRGRLTERGGSGGFHLQTDEHGMFRLPIQHREFANADPWEELPPFRIATFSYQHPGGGRMWCGRLDLSHELPPGDNDMGQITLGPDLFLAGIVINEEGQYINGVSLEVEGVSPDILHWKSEPMLFPIGQGKLKSQSNGRFSILSTDSVTSIHLVAKKDGYLTTKFEFDPGTSDHTLVMKSGKGIRLRILTDADVDVSSIQGTLKTVRPDGQDWYTSFSFYGEDGSANSTVKDLEPGNYSLVLRTKVLREEILTLDNIIVGNDAAADTRLDPIDLRGKLHARKIKVIAPDGKIPDFFFLAPPNSHHRGVRLPNHAILHTPHANWEIELWSDSRATNVIIHEPVTKISLLPAYLLQVDLGPTPQARPGSTLTLKLNLSDGRFYFSEFPLTAGQSLKIPLHFAGDYHVEFLEKFAAHNEHSFDTRFLYLDGQALMITIPDSMQPTQLQVNWKRLSATPRR